MNNMRTFKYLFMIVLSMTLLNSCFEDPEIDLDLNDEGTNVAGFDDASLSFPAIADGEEYDFEVQVKVIGPTSMDLTSDITLSVEAAEGSTAIEGTHYRIDNKDLTLTKANNYLGRVTVTMLTEGIETPLDELPVLLLGTTNVSGADNVTETGKPVNISFSYACPSFLAGTYNVETTRGDGAVGTWTETITETGVGEYLSEYVGLWDPPLNPDYGMKFTDVCDVITVPQQNLADMYSNQVYSHLPGSVNPETGVITINYTIEFSSGNSTYTAVYTPVE